MKKLLYVSIAVLLMIACKKDSYQVPYPSIFFANGIKDYKPLRAFTAKGEIKDDAVINKIETRNISFLAPDAIERNRPVMDSIHYISASEAQIYSLQYSHFNKTFELRHSGNDFVFTAPTSYSAEMDTTMTPRVIIASLFYPLLYGNKRDPSGPFYWYDFTEQRFAAQITADQLSIPTMVIAIQYSSGNGWISLPINNRFNPQFDFKLLGPADTFAVREYNLIMQKVGL